MELQVVDRLGQRAQRGVDRPRFFESQAFAFGLAHALVACQVDERELRDDHIAGLHSLLEVDRQYQVAATRGVVQRLWRHRSKLQTCIDQLDGLSFAFQRDNDQVLDEEGLGFLINRTLQGLL